MATVIGSTWQDSVHLLYVLYTFLDLSNFPKQNKNESKVPMTGPSKELGGRGTHSQGSQTPGGEGMSRQVERWVENPQAGRMSVAIQWQGITQTKRIDNKTQSQNIPPSEQICKSKFDAKKEISVYSIMRNIKIQSKASRFF